MNTVILKHRTVIAALTALLWCLGVMAVASYFVVADVQARLRSEGASYISQVDDVFSEIDSVLASLEALPPTGCTDDLLLMMRREIFLNHHIQDVILFESEADVPSCSASKGRLMAALPLPAPDITRNTRLGRKVWFNLPVSLFKGSMSTYFLRQSRFGVMVNMDVLHLPPVDERWEAYAPEVSGAYGAHAYGEEGLYAELAQAWPLSMRRLLSETACSNKLAACIIIASPPAKAVLDQGLFAAFSLSMAGATSIMMFLLVHRRLTNRTSMAGRIRRALAHGHGFRCEYQVIVDARDARPIGCEVLMRYEDELGRIPRREFTRYVQEIGRTWDYTEIMLARALADLEPVASGNADFMVAVNLYACDLRDEFHERLKASPQFRHAVQSHIRLNCEILETGIEENLSIGRSVAHLRNLGFAISVDDFGSGASNIQNLRRIHADYIKIDKSFMHGLDIEDTNIRASLIPNIMTMAKDVGVEVIAEGVESPMQAQVLSALDIHYAQGYFYAPPVGIERLKDLIREGKALEGLSPFRTHIQNSSAMELHRPVFDDDHHGEGQNKDEADEEYHAQG